jgi:hypothetical protein
VDGFLFDLVLDYFFIAFLDPYEQIVVLSPSLTGVNQFGLFIFIYVENQLIIGSGIKKGRIGLGISIHEIKFRE